MGIDSRLAADLNARLDNIWRDQFSGADDVLAPRYFHKTGASDLLFVGLNPSFANDKIGVALKKLGHEIAEPEVYFSWRNRDRFDLRVCAALEGWAKENYAYYKHHHDLAEELNCGLAQLDLFQFRRTTQKDYLDVLEKAPVFRDRQLQIFDDALAAFNPRCIIVANAKASEIFKDRYGLKFDQGIGTYTLYKNGNMTPVFLSAQFSGGALDRYSRERLFWHVAQAMRRPNS
ncbi:hypothetical protein [Hyphococcus sp.]|uniref:hypothetical protein n=1 Tax=Hyphococcus sp. TaxID=2038636 RepID=UPI0035C77AD9